MSQIIFSNVSSFQEKKAEFTVFFPSDIKGKQPFWLKKNEDFSKRDILISDKEIRKDLIDMILVKYSFSVSSKESPSGINYLARIGKFKFKRSYFWISKLEVETINTYSFVSGDIENTTNLEINEIEKLELSTSSFQKYQELYKIGNSLDYLFLNFLSLKNKVLGEVKLWKNADDIEQVLLDLNLSEEKISEPIIISLGFTNEAYFFFSFFTLLFLSLVFFLFRWLNRVEDKTNDSFDEYDDDSLPL